MLLDQKEFEHLIKLKKQFKENDQLILDLTWSRDIISIESKDTFILDYYKGRIEIKKFTYNKRFKKVITLLRFDSFGRHTNPDGKMFDGPHIHIYREEYGSKFAVPVKEIGIDENNFDKEKVLKKILKYCNVVDCPTIPLTLF